MNGTGNMALPWATILALVLLAVVIVVAVWRVMASKKAGRRDAAERLAQAAEADHESAATRHEGGA